MAAGIAGGTVGVGIDAGVHIFNLQTRAFIGDDPSAPANKGPGNVQAAGSVAIAANDASNINEIVGVFAAGAVGVAAGAGVNVFTKDTEAFIGVGAKVTGQGYRSADHGGYWADRQQLRRDDIDIHADEPDRQPGDQREQSQHHVERAEQRAIGQSFLVHWGRNDRHAEPWGDGPDRGRVKRDAVA